MTVSPTLATTARAAHDVGLAAWFGGTMFGKLAHNPSLRRIEDHAQRGAVTNAAWNGYNPVNAVGLGAAALGWAAARTTESRPDRLAPRERSLARAKDVLLGVAVTAGVVSGVEGVRLAQQAPGGAVPVETGTKPAPETPPKAARMQRVIGAAGNVSLLSGAGLVAINAVMAQLAHTEPPKRRAVRGASPLWLAPLAAAAVAAGDQARRAT